MVSPIERSRRNLNALVYQLWSIAQGKSGKDSFPVRICDDASTVKAILADPDTFRKNYSFLDSFAEGRFSDNYPHWAGRAVITQPHYNRNEFLRGSADVTYLYKFAFENVDCNSIDDVSDIAIGVAVSVISRVFGLQKDIPWDASWVLRVRNALGERQSIGFYGTSPTRFVELGEQFSELRAECETCWDTVPEIKALLDAFRTKGQDIPDFDPAAELIQNIIAATETTAATLCWAVAVFACRPDLLQALQTSADSTNNFVQELLRVYPPVPFVTRYAAKDTNVGDQNFAEGEAIVVSVMGLHYSNYWSHPQEFIPSRFSESLPQLRDHYIPFLTGPRACGGRKLAELELNAAVEVLVNLFDFHCDKPESVGFDYGLSFRPIIPSLRITKRQLRHQRA